MNTEANVIPYAAIVRKRAARGLAEKLEAIMMNSPEAAAYIQGMIDMKYHDVKIQAAGAQDGSRRPSPRSRGEACT